MIEVIKNEVYIEGLYYQYTNLKFYINNVLIHQEDTEKDTEEDIELIKKRLYRDLKIESLLQTKSTFCGVKNG